MTGYSGRNINTLILGNVSAAPLSPACGGCTLSSSQNLRLDIVRTGLSYKFGGPVLAKY